MEMARYILQIFRYSPNVVFSWGFQSPIALSNGLRFRVEGFIHKGWVEVTYNEGSDLFSVRTLDSKGNVKEERTDVYIDGLVDIIDGLVERCSNYEQRVKQEYGFISK